MAKYSVAPAGTVVASRKTAAPQPNSTMVMMKGTIDHTTSSITEWCSCMPISPARRRRNWTKKTKMNTAISSEKKALITTEKKNRLSTLEARVEACLGKRGKSKRFISRRFPGLPAGALAGRRET